MGTFGLCNFLNQRKIPAKILNLAFFDHDVYIKAVEKVLKYDSKAQIAIAINPFQL